METLARDVRFGIRSLRRTPGVTIAMIATLALGIGASTTMFSVVDGILIDPLPFGNAHRLVWTVNRGSRPYDAMAPADMRDFARMVPSFEDIGGYLPTWATIQGPLAPEHVAVAEVTDNWFRLLGVRPQLGRGFLPGEQGTGQPSVVVISDGLWRSAFGGDPHILGRAVRIDAARYTVVGIAPRSFDFPQHTGIWRPAALTPALWNGRNTRVFRGPIALLAPGASFERARGEARVAAARLRAQDPAAEAGLAFDIQPMRDHLVGDTRTPLVLLLAAVGALLAIACVNVAALMLVRASARSVELGVRLALGAGRGRVVAQLMIESLLVAVAGGAIAAVLAKAGVHLLVAANVGNLPLIGEVGVNGDVLAFAIGITSLVGVAFGLGPAWRASRTNVVDALRSGGRSASAGRATSRTRQSLVALEIALVLPLLVSASLLARSFSRLVTSDVGFRPDHLVHFNLTLPQCGTDWNPDSTCSAAIGTHYNAFADRRQFTHELLARLRALPHIESASAGMGAPFTEWAYNQGAVTLLGHATPNRVNGVESKYVDPDYFKTLGIPVIQGRDFTAADYSGRDDGCSYVAIVSRGAVRAYFGSTPPIGAQLTGLCDSTTRVIGVVGDTKTESLTAPPEPALYRSLDDAAVNLLTFLIRSTAPPEVVMNAARREVAAIDRSIPVYDMDTMEHTIERAAGPARLAASVVSGFAAAALLLALVGIYGLVAHIVRERRRELGIRMALGARPAQAIALTVRSGLTAVLWGVLPGIGLALASSRLLSGFLYDVGAVDIATYVPAIGALIVVASVACWLPARRAAAIDLTAAIRAD
jgi:putative ABC transport system permease protein